MSYVCPQLWRNLRVYQIYGANTNVGKTVMTTLMGKGIQHYRRDDRISYLKPISTGPLDDSDAGFVSRHLGDSVDCKTLYQFDDPVSPHIAATTIVPDSEILQRVANHITKNAQGGPGFMFVETAGGPHSPAPSGISQADLYRPLRLPVILIADAKLGGISATICAYESLRLRGYDIAFIAMQDNHDLRKYQNYEYLSKYFRGLGIPTWHVIEPPAKDPEAVRDMQNVEKWLGFTVKHQSVEQMVALMVSQHEERVKDLGNAAKSAVNRIWWPFTQHKPLKHEDITVIDSAYGDYFSTLKPQKPPTDVSTLESQSGRSMLDATDHETETNILQPTLDGSSSWWTQGLGHGNPTLALAAAYAAGRYGHVMFAQAIHRPALTLAGVLLNSMSSHLSKVFFSDNGSTGMEVAVKMGLRAACQRYGWNHQSREVGIIGLEGSYHGDTIGSMDMSEPGTFNKKVEWYRGRGFWFSPPKVKMSKGKWIIEMPESLHEELGPRKSFDTLADVFNLSRKATRDGPTYENYIKRTIEHLTKVEGRRFGALVMEPVVLGAGGMVLVDPLFQLALARVVRRNPNLFASAESASPKDAEDVPSDWASVNTGKEWRGLPIIHDEVFTGLYRLGRMSSSTFLNVQPDISVHAKVLTGGLVPLCVTLAKDAIYEAFLSDSKEDALLHGHSYTAHPVGCQVALTSVAMLKKMTRDGSWDAFRSDWGAATASPVRTYTTKQRNSQVFQDLKAAVDSVLQKATPVSGPEDAKSSEQPQEVGSLESSQPVRPKASKAQIQQKSPVWSWWSKGFVTRLSFANQVEGVWALGSVLAISLRDEAGAGYTSNAAKFLQQHLLARNPYTDFNIHSRTLGNVIYFMCSQTSKIEDIRRWEQVIGEGLGISGAQKKEGGKIVDVFDARSFL